jgi:hypothetical protein
MTCIFQKELAMSSLSLKRSFLLHLRAKAVTKDSIQREPEKWKGLFGMTPSMNKLLRKLSLSGSANVFLPGVNFLLLLLPKKIDYNKLFLGSKEDVDRWVREIVKELVKELDDFQDYENILSGGLVLDDKRLAYIGKLEGLIDTWWKIWFELTSTEAFVSFL